MSTVPIIASVGDLDWAIRRAERAVENRAYVAQRAVDLGVAWRIPAGWGPVSSLVASVPKKERDEAADKGFALPDGSFPIRNTDELGKAVKLWGNAKDPDKAKRYIIKRARALDAVGSLPEDWGVTASAVTAAGWNASLHPRDRNGKFIEKLGLLNLFDGDGFGKPSMRAEAVGVRREGNKDVLTVRAKSVGNYGGKARAVGDEFDVESDRVEAAPDAKAKMTHPVFTGKVEPKGPPIKGEATDLKKAQDRADAAAAELADAEASGDKTRITKARTSNTAAQKNLEKQQALEDQAGSDLTSQLEQSVAQLETSAEPEAGDDAEFDDFEARLRSEAEAGSDFEDYEKGDPMRKALADVKNGRTYEEATERALGRPRGSEPGSTDDFGLEDDGTNDSNYDEDGTLSDDAEGDMTEDDEDFADLEEYEENRGAIPAGQSDDEEPTLADEADALMEDGFEDYTPEEVEQLANQLRLNGDVAKAKELEQAFADAGGYDDEDEDYEDSFPQADLSPAEDWSEGDGPIDDEIEYAKNMLAEIESYEEVNNEDGDSDPLLQSRINDLRTGLMASDLNDPTVRDEIRERADLARAALIDEGYADPYELPEFGGGPAANHGISDDLGDSDTTPYFEAKEDEVFGVEPLDEGGMTPTQRAADEWENEYSDYLNGLDESTRANIESAIADEDWADALRIMDDNYEYGQGDAIDSFRERVVNKEAYDVSQQDAADAVYTELVDIFGKNPDADPDEVGRELMDRGHTPDAVDAGMERYRSDNGPSESAVAQQFAKENPEPTTDLYAADDPEVQKAFDEWAAAARAESGLTDEQIAQRVEHAEKYGGSWKANTPEEAAERGTSNAQYGVSRDRLELFPVGDPGKIGFGGYEVWHVNPDGSKNGGRGEFPDRESAVAFIDAANAEYDRKLQERVDAAPKQVDDWAANKDPFTVKQAMLNIEASLIELDPQDPNDADQIKVLQARRARMEEILAKAPAPEPDPVDADEPAVPAGKDAGIVKVKPTSAPGPGGGDNSPQRSAIEMSLGKSADNKGVNVDSDLMDVFAQPDAESAHKRMAQVMTQLKLGGKQRARMRQLLDLHWGDSGENSAAIQAKATAEMLSDDNPLKSKLEAAVAKVKATEDALDTEVAPQIEANVKKVASKLDGWMTGEGPSGVDWLGFGYMGERESMPNSRRYEADALVAQLTKGWSDEELFAWANSKEGRYFGERAKSDLEAAAQHIKKQPISRRVPEYSLDKLKSEKDVKPGDRVYSLGSYYGNTVQIDGGTVVAVHPSERDEDGDFTAPSVAIRLDDGSKDVREYWHVARNPEPAPDFS